MSLMEHELAGALADFPQFIAFWDNGHWCRVPCAIDTRAEQDARTADFLDAAETGTEAVCPAFELARFMGSKGPRGLIGKPVLLDGRELRVAQVAGTPGDVTLTLTLARRA